VALDILHDEEGAQGAVADLVDADDVGMLEAGGGAGFGVEPGRGDLVLAELVQENLDGDEAAKLFCRAL
jgi:hypothetical protein